MRKLVALSVTFLGIGAAQAAPEPLKCTAKYDPLNPATMNCFADEVFILNGAEIVSVPTSPPVDRALVDCADKAAPAMGKDSKNCGFGRVDAPLSLEGLDLAVTKAIQVMQAKAGGAPLPQWDEVVVFSSDFGPPTQAGPLFYRAPNASLQPINEVAGIGLGAPVARDPARPYVGIINAGNTRTIGPTPGSGSYGPCGTAPRRPVDDPAPTTTPALCAPTLYNYFDSLAQATANLYGPYLTTDRMAHGSSATSMPALKTALVSFTAPDMVAAKIMGGPATNVWNGLLNLRGSILGGNTFTDNGNGTWSVTRPPAFQGVSAPYENSQVLRFQPMDLYVMGFAPSSAVPPTQSFMWATPTNVYQPPGVTSLSPAVGAAMGVRTSGVSLRGTGSATANNAVPKMIPFSDFIAASGGERSPGYDQAPQQIRQLWILVSKPEAVIDAAVADGAKKDEQVKDQGTQLTNLQRARRAFSQYFYMLTSYKGRVYTTGDGSAADDNAYWEFGGARDDAATFQAQGLQIQVNGQESIPNSGGKQLSVLRVVSTPGREGRIRLDRARHPIRIDGKQDIGSAPNNVLSIRMRVPSDPALLASLKANSSGENGFYASFTFEGGGKSVSFNLPELESAFLVPDGKFRTYSVNLAANTDFKAGVWDTFTFTPSNRAANDIEVEFIKVGWVDGPKDADKNCADAEQKDGWLDNVEDNCPRLYNPDQADGNNDGVGDACEDYDGDNKLNSCDNCPTTTNTSQRDENSNKIGDACDGTSTNGCFFQESAVAGAVTPGSALFGATLLVFGVMVAGAVRRRRRK
jgi:hypothetical protein